MKTGDSILALRVLRTAIRSYAQRAASIIHRASVLLILAAASGCSDSRLDAQLMDAAERGQSAEVARLLNAGADPHARRQRYGKLAGASALDLAASNGNVDVVMVFLEHGADRDEKNRALSITAGSGHPEVVIFLLEHGAEINSGAMVSAAVGSRTDIIRLLLSRGADINARDPHGLHETPLMAAAGVGNPDLVVFLLQSGAQVNLPDGTRSPLIAASHNAGNPEVVRILIRAGARLNATDEFGRTALHLACQYGPAAALVLIDAGADVNLKEKLQGNTALMSAAHYGHLEVVRALIRAGADVNARGPYGYTALMDAAVGGHTEVATVLISATADVIATNDAGEDAAKVAKRFEHHDLAKLLRAHSVR